MKVSIIIPVYNVAPYIGDCLQSVMRQSYKGDVECILVDDCGLDESIVIAEQMIAEYDGSIQFKIFHHIRNRGLSAARNTGISHATGDYLYFIDSDDMISENCIALLMMKVEDRPEVEMVQGNVKTLPIKNLSRHTVRVRVPEALTNEEVRMLFFQKNQMNGPAWNKLLKRSFVMEHNLRFMEGVVYEDTPWTFHLLKHLTHVCFIPDVTYFYKRREHSIVTGTSSKDIGNSYKIIYQHILDNLTPGQEREEVDYYGGKYAYFYSKYSHDIPTFRDGYLCWAEKVKAYGNYGVYIKLVASKYLAKIKYGWLVFSLLSRAGHPASFLVDAQRIWYRKRYQGAVTSA